MQNRCPKSARPVSSQRLLQLLTNCLLNFPLYALFSPNCPVYALFIQNCPIYALFSSNRNLEMALIPLIIIVGGRGFDQHVQIDTLFDLESIFVIISVLTDFLCVCMYVCMYVPLENGKSLCGLTATCIVS